MPTLDPMCPHCLQDRNAQAQRDELLAEFHALSAWVSATSKLLATVPRQSGPSSRTLLDAIEGGKAWAHKANALIAKMRAS